MTINLQDQELYELHHKRANDGDAESQFKLGQFYEMGQGVVKNFKLAELWYSKAAERKHPMARLNLSWLRLNEEDANFFDTVRNVR